MKQIWTQNGPKRTKMDQMSSDFREVVYLEWICIGVLEGMKCAIRAQAVPKSLTPTRMIKSSASSKNPWRTSSLKE